MRFFSRQRHIIAYSHRYIITDEDLDRPQEIAYNASTNVEMSKQKKESMIEYLLNGFNADENETDRRIFYEVTGRQLIQDEFDDLDTSDEERRIQKALNQVVKLPDDD